jgi:hypothetical protein
VRCSLSLRRLSTSLLSTASPSLVLLTLLLLRRARCDEALEGSTNSSLSFFC